MFTFRCMLYLVIVLALAEEINTEKIEIGDRPASNLPNHEWQIYHLKPTDFQQESRRSEQNCRPETFAEKVERYKRRLAKDPGGLKYISADPMPVDEEEMKKEFRDCVPHGNQGKYNAESSSTVKEEEEITPTADATIRETVKVRKAETKTVKVDKKTTETVTAKAHAQLRNDDTTVEVTGEYRNETVHQGTTQKAAKSSDSYLRKRKSSDYLFSREEYEDEVTDFDVDTCPEYATVIILEEDLIRAYDVECEERVEWGSLI